MPLMRLHQQLVRPHPTVVRVSGHPSSTTRDRLLSAAEELFAARGIDAVSLREINRLAGAKNAVAVQYHFADREGVVRAVLAKHRPTVEAARHALLDQLAEGPTLRGLAGALVRPLAAKLSDPDGGLHYLQIHAEVVNRPRWEASDEPVVDSVDRWRAAVEAFLDEDALRLHRRFTAIRFCAAELGRRAASGPHTDDRLFVSSLVDLVTAVLREPVSAETLALAAERDQARTPRPSPRAARSAARA